MYQANSRFKVLASGVFCLMLTMSIARFSYTPMIPIMFEQAGLTTVLAGWLATINYAGYMVGALTATLVGNLIVKDRIYRVGLVLAVVTTCMMGLSSDPWLWGISRFVAGFSTAAGLLIGAGFGFVISATYIVAIVENQPALEGQGEVAFLILGICAAPACISWDLISRKIGILNALLLAYLIHAVGIVLPALDDSLLFALLSAILYGFTFVGIVSIVLTMAGRFYPTKPSKLMGLLTMSYGVPQIIAPAIAGYLASKTGHYDGALYMASGFVMIGSVAILAIKKWSVRDMALLES